jgi:hypothetical protein
VYLTENLVDGPEWYSGRPAVLGDNTGPHEVIAGLRGSMTYRLAVQVYQRHYDRGDGRCVRCGLLAPCPPRGHAAAVIRAGGDDPGYYDLRPVSRSRRYAGYAPEDRRGLPHMTG